MHFIILCSVYCRQTGKFFLKALVTNKRKIVHKSFFRRWIFKNPICFVHTKKKIIVFYNKPVFKYNDFRANTKQTKHLIFAIKSSILSSKYSFTASAEQE